MKNRSDKMIKDNSNKIMLKFNFPEHWIIIEAIDIDEANKELQKIISKK